jgi:hypothetical protein
VKIQTRPFHQKRTATIMLMKQRHSSADINLMIKKLTSRPSDIFLKMFNDDDDDDDNNNNNNNNPQQREIE